MGAAHPPTETASVGRNNQRALRRMVWEQVQCAAFIFIFMGTLRLLNEEKLFIDKNQV